MEEKKIYSISKSGKDLGLFSQNFIEMVTKGYYVDKSLFLKDFIDSHADVTLITRPRRFGKSLNMDMFRTFFEKTDEDTSLYFNDLAIWQCGEKYASVQGRYPVIFLDFKNTGGDSWEEMRADLKKTIANEYVRHDAELSGFVPESRIEVYNRIKNEIGTDADYKDSLRLLTELLHARHGEKPVVLIDEYDATILSGMEHGYYSKATGFLRGLFSAALKGNPDLNFAFLTGVNQIAGAGLFSGFNNADVCSILDDRYSEYFGFTKDEVKKLLADYDASDKYDEVCEWYDGYIFGHEEIFNPISISKYVCKGYNAQTYWVNTSSDSAFKSIITKLTKEVLSVLIDLSVGQSISASVKAELTYDDFNDINNVYSVLFTAGYLKLHVPEGEHREEELDRVIKLASGGEDVPLSLVNKEIAKAYTNDILKYANGVFRLDLASLCLQGAVNKREPALIGEGIKKLVSESLSFYDDTEDFYHGFVLGLVSQLRSIYAITSNRESGKGRFDVALEPLRGMNALPGIIMEFKVCDEEEDLSAKAAEALGQIDKKDYMRDMTMRGVKDILKMGMAFCGKEVEFAL